MPPSFFPQTQSWGGGGGGGWSGGDGWSMARVNGLPSAHGSMLAQQTPLAHQAAATQAASQAGQHMQQQQQHLPPSGADASWAANRGPPLVVEANRGKSLGNGGYSLF